MIWTALGMFSFGLLILFEYQKCLSAEKKTKRKNPWFLLGTGLLLIDFAGMACTLPAASGLQMTGGAAVLGTGLILYILVLTGGPKKKGYVRDDASADIVSRRGIYGKIRHPGVWCFLLCSLGFGIIYPDGMGSGLWLALMNILYTWLQDRCFFPVYLKEYEEYKKEVPYLFPKRKTDR